MAGHDNNYLALAGLAFDSKPRAHNLPITLV